MLQPPTLKISEIFSSVQGEGLRQGEPTHFIRLAGCNLSCSFCDTKYAWAKGQMRSLDDILLLLDAAQKKFPCDWVCLTGGEPFLQDISGLAQAIKDKGYKIQIETNGTRYRSFPVDWITLSPKPPDYITRREWRAGAAEVKLIVSKDLDLDRVLKIRDTFPAATPLLLQPQSHRVWSRNKAWRLLGQAARAGQKNIRLSLQLHKIWGLP